MTDGTDGGNMKTDSRDAPRERLADLREWLMDRIDGSEETRGEDSLISGFIAEIDALDDQIVGLTRPKTIAEWVAANKYVEPTPTPQSKTQQKRFAAQSEPRGCPTPGACSAVTAVAEQTRLRQMAEHERDALLEQLIAARSATAAPVAWMYEENGERMFGHPDGYRPKDAVPLYAGCHHDASQPSPTTKEQPK